MAENQQGRPNQAPLQTTPGWELRSRGGRVAAAKAAAQAASKAPEKAQKTQNVPAPATTQPAPKPASQAVPVQAPSRPTPAAAPMAPAQPFEIKPESRWNFTRLKDTFAGHATAAREALQAIKIPSVKIPRPDLSAVKWPSMPSLKMPSVTLPKIKLPSLTPSTKTKWALGGVAAVAAASMMALMVHTLKEQANNGPQLADNNEEVTAPVAATPAPAPQPPTAQAPVEAKPSANKLFTLNDLPAPKALSDAEVKRLSGSSKIPADVVAQALHIYKHVASENYEPQSTDKIELLYTKANDILLARIHTGNVTRTIYGFEDAGGDFGFYTENGRRIDGSPLTSPVEGQLLAGYKPRRGFGTHFHPIHRKNMFHDGVDIPAARGTPVYATSDGVIEKKGRMSGYGETVILRHPHNIQSVYAHLSGYAKQLPAGTQVKQGQLLGYVGSTGWATGPHLHFEIRRGGKAVNPLKVASFSSPNLEGQDKPAFDIAVNRVKQYMSGDTSVIAGPITEKRKAPGGASTAQPTIREAFQAPSSGKDLRINKPIYAAAQEQGLHPQLLYRLFFKESGTDTRGHLKTNARSDRGAEGLCQFTEEQFLSTMKRHGEALGFGRYADMIEPQVGRDRRTYYVAGRNTDLILNLRNKPEVAIPVCAAHVREDLSYLKAEIKREPTFTDSAIAHFMGRGVAKDFIAAYDNPRTRENYAYKYANPVNYDGPTNMRVFFENGDRRKPYTVAEVYENKRRIMGDTQALASAKTWSIANGAKPQ